MTRKRRGLTAVIAAVLAATGVTGCSESDPAARPEVPEGAVSAVENQPRGLGNGLEVIASDIDDSGAYLAIYAEDGDEFSGRTEVGETHEIAGHGITLVATWVDPDQEGAPGSVGSTAYLLVDE